LPITCPPRGHRSDTSDAEWAVLAPHLDIVLQEEIDSISQEVEAAQATQPRDAAAWAAALERAIALVRREPAAEKSIHLSNVVDDLAAAYQDLGRYDEAIQTIEDAYDAGWDLDFDVDIRVAGILLNAGRVQEADELLAEARAEDPDDVTLQGAAGLLYFSRGHHEAALAWLTDALELALRTGDRDGYVRELLFVRDMVLTKALGRKTDEWQARGDAFLAALPIDGTDPG
jgi:tetratricopeptide (TPR) repeat protein